ncbi:Ionotropic receptor 545 [Blattella germanica]|nr:Ionotropic receptor 545 [Blattella germanica]
MVIHAILVDFHAENLVETHLSELTVSIASIYFDIHLPVAVQITNRITYNPRKSLKRENVYGDDIIKKLNTECHVPQLILGPPIKPELVSGLWTNVKFGFYLLVLSPNDIFEEEKMANVMMSRLIVSNAQKGKLVIVTTRIYNIFEEQHYTAKQILQMILNFGFINAIVITPREISDISSLQYDIFGWNPNEQSNICGLHIDKIKHLDTWVVQHKMFLFGTNLFPKRPNVNMNLCTLIVTSGTLYPYFYINRFKKLAGIFYHFVMALEDALNCSTIPNTKPHKYSQIFFPAFIAETDADFQNYGIYPYFFLDFYWYVPSPLEKLRWKCLFRAFKFETWILVFLTFIIGSLALFLLEKSGNHSENHDSNISFADQLMSSMKTHLCITTVIHYKGLLATTIFLLWLFYCLIVNIAYQSALFGFMVNPGFGPQIKTLKDLDESGLEKICEFSVNGNPLDSLFGKQFSKYQVCKNIPKCVEDIVERRSQALITNSFMGRVVEKLVSKHGHSLLTPVEERVFTIYITLGLGKLSSMIQKPVELLVRRLFTSGILNKFIEEEELYLNRIFALNQDGNSAFSLKLSHLQSAFYLSIIGIFMAFIVFIFEIVANLKKDKI